MSTVHFKYDRQQKTTHFPPLQLIHRCKIGVETKPHTSIGELAHQLNICSAPIVPLIRMFYHGIVLVWYGWNSKMDEIWNRMVEWDGEEAGWRRGGSHLLFSLELSSFPSTGSARFVHVQLVASLLASHRILFVIKLSFFFYPGLPCLCNQFTRLAKSYLNFKTLVKMITPDALERWGNVKTSTTWVIRIYDLLV